MVAYFSPVGFQFPYKMSANTGTCVSIYCDNNSDATISSDTPVETEVWEFRRKPAPDPRLKEIEERKERERAARIALNARKSVLATSRMQKVQRVLRRPARHDKPMIHQGMYNGPI